MKICGIYKITSISNKIYIGQSRDIESRFRGYKRLSCKSQTALFNSFKKHGIDKHKFEIIHICIEADLNNLERYYQDLYCTLNRNGLNCRLTNSFDKIGIMSDESKLKLSKALKGRKLTKEQIQKHIAYRTGKFVSQETKDKIRNTLKGRKRPPEIGIAVGNAHRGTKHSKEHIEKTRLANIGRKFSKESLLKKGLKTRRYILNIETGVYYHGADEAAFSCGLKAKTLRNMLGGFRKNKTSLIYV